jgi:hypothetical protein
MTEDVDCFFAARKREDQGERADGLGCDIGLLSKVVKRLRESTPASASPANARRPFSSFHRERSVPD